MKESAIGNVLEWFKESGFLIVNEPEQPLLELTEVRAITEAKECSLSFVTEKLEENIDSILANTLCKLVVISEGLYDKVSKEILPENIVFVVAKNPKVQIISFCEKFLEFGKKNTETKVHKLSSIANNVILGKGVEVSQFVVIEEDCIIGDNCSIGANTVIKKGTIIGCNVAIGSCNVIGGVGFGYSKIEGENNYTQFPHYGCVIINDNVDIGNNTCIDRGSLKDTIIRKGAKIDNLVHIAHNVEIGENSLIIANSMIAGSVVIGDNCWVAPSCNVINGVNIANNTTIGMSSTVTKSIDAETVVVGNPAIPLADFLVLRAHQKKIILNKKQ